MNQKLLALYGLKWNPFSPELPVDAIYVPPKIENFCWRIEHAQIRVGGFYKIYGDPGSGKSIVLCGFANRLVTVIDGEITFRIALESQIPCQFPAAAVHPHGRRCENGREA